MTERANITRRSFLRGAGGTLVGLPFLHAIHGRAQAARPLRLVVVFHSQGTIHNQWRPSATGRLSGGLPPILRPLEPHRDLLNVLSHVDNVVRPFNTNSNGHNAAARTVLTCQPFQGVREGRQPDNAPADGPSIDWVIGPRLQGAAPRAVINLGVNAQGLGENTIHWHSAGQAASILSDPREATRTLFSHLEDATGEPATPSRATLYRQRRSSVLDRVGEAYRRLSASVPPEDRARLEAHAEQIRALERLHDGSGDFTVESCAHPSLDGVFPSGYRASNPAHDPYSATAQIENIAMALACDVTRVATLQFVDYHDPRFPWLFDGDPNAVLRGSNTYPDWHAMVHEARGARDAVGVDHLALGFAWYMEQVARLVQRLSQIEDGPGQTLIDNTLVLSVSEFGDGGAHYTSDLPVVLIGHLGGRLPTGRHLDLDGYTTGDLYTTLQLLFTGDSTPFGMTGADRDGRPLHRGLLPGLG